MTGHVAYTEVQVPFTSVVSQTKGKDHSRLFVQVTHMNQTWEENSGFAVDRGNQMLFESVCIYINT